MNKISELIKKMEKPGFPFIPNKAFYGEIGVKQKRFAQILRNEKQPTVDELERIGIFIGVRAQELIAEKNN